MGVASDRVRGVRPSPGIAGVKPYSVPKHGAPIDLKLDANEGMAPPDDLLVRLASAGSDLMRRYPDTSALQMLLAQRLGVDSGNVIVTAGGDDALDRLCRAVLAPGRELLTTDPSFEMLPRYARITGATVRELDWPAGPFPTDEMINAIRPDTTMIAVVSPNNPSGSVATAEDLRRLAAAAPGAILLCDFAYIEFADEDLTELALSLPNTIVMRTLSKAWSCAGLRVGYAVGPQELIGWMRASGGPYAVARPSIALATARLAEGEEEMRTFVAQVREDRKLVIEALRERGADVTDSQGNFAFARLHRAAWLTDALAGQGISIRAYPGHPRLADAVRITLPGEAAQGQRLAHAIRQSLAPEALLVSLDGVLTDITTSVARAMEAAAAQLGDTITVDDVIEARAVMLELGFAELLQWMLEYRGIVKVTAEQSRAAFEQCYRGSEHVAGMRENEKLAIKPARLRAIAARVPLGLVTMRPRADVDYFLDRHDLKDVFEAVVYGEDFPPFPHPAGLQRAMATLGVTRAWYVGEGLREVQAARAAGLVPLSMVSMGERFEAASAKLTRAGTARVLHKLEEVEALLP